MVKNSYQLSGIRDKWFLEQHRTDEYLLEEFHPGDTVVVCAKCHRVWLIDTWELKNCCPNNRCRHKETEPFGKKKIRIQTSSDSRIKIVKNANSGFSGADRAMTTISGCLDKTDRILLHWTGKIVSCIFKAGLIACLGLSLLQFRNEESPINGRSREDAYYQEVFVKIESRASASFSGAIDKQMTAIKKEYGIGD